MAAPPVAIIRVSTVCVFSTSVLTHTRAHKHRHASYKMCTFSYTAKGLYITQMWKIMDEIVGGNKSIWTDLV